MVEIVPSTYDTHGYAVAGFGPAGCGFLLHAIKTNAIDRLVDDGLVIIERSPAPGPGKVGRYQLTGNSLSRAFLDCVDDPALDWLFGDLRQTHPSIKQLRDLEFEAPPLDVVGEFLTAMAKVTMDYLIEDHGVPVLLETEIERIQQRIDGSYSLRLRNLESGRAFKVAARNVICTLGGRQSMEVVQRSEVLPGIALGETTDRLMVSDDFLMMSDEAIRAAVPIDEGSSADVVVVGGSHSAMSTIDRLCQALVPVGLKQLTMLHASPLRLYYATPDEARGDNYPFLDPADICPLSGRVNRFGGLRYRSFDVARSILKTGRMPEHDVLIKGLALTSSEPTLDLEVRQALERAPAVITCMGYQANLPPVVDDLDAEMPLCNWSRGVDVDETGQVMTVCQGPMRGLYAFGIGSTSLRRSEAIGGEPSFRGSADGVWLYHNHGGSVILEALLRRAPDRKAHYPQTARVTNDVQAFE